MMKNFFRMVITAVVAMMALGATAQPEGQFYLFNTASKQFMSRSATGSNVDSFGIPVEIKKGESGYSMMFLDNGRYVGVQSGDVKGDLSSAAYAAIEATDGGYTVAFKESELLGVDMNSQSLKSADDPTSSSFSVLWQLLTQSERDAIVAEQQQQQIEAVAKAAGIDVSGASDKKAKLEEALAAYTQEEATAYVANPTLAASQDNWTVNVLAGNSYIAYKSYPMTLYQNSAVEVSQTVAVPNGVYKATIQSTYRSSKREYLAEMADRFSICNAYFAANENKVQAVEWTKVRTSSTLPYSRGDFDNFPTNPKYTSEVWAYVKDGQLTLKFVVPSINNSQGDYDLNWFVFGNVTLTRYFKADEEAMSELDAYNDLAEQSTNPSTYYDVVNTLKQKLKNGMMTEEEIAGLDQTLRTALFDMMNATPAKSGQYDITRFVVNPSFTNGIRGWSAPGSNFTVASGSGIAECFNIKTTARLFQTLKNMPEGNYTMKVQGFYRAGEWKQALANYERGKDNIKAFLYIDSIRTQTSPMKSIFEDGCYQIVGKSAKSADVFAVVSGRGFPHSHYIGSDRSRPIKTPDLVRQTFDHGHYWNEMTVNHKAGNLVIGITQATGGLAESWIAVDNFRLYYSAASPVTLVEGEPLPVADDTYADVVLKKQFKAGEMTPLAVPCQIPASCFKAVYEVGSLDATTQTAVLYPADAVHANVPCYVVADKDMDEIRIDRTYISAAKKDQLPVLWDGGLIYPLEDAFTWKTTTVSDEEFDASHFTQFTIVEPMNMTFTANIENFRARQFLENVSYPEPETPSVIGNYFKPAPPRLDIPHNIGIPLMAEKVVGATVKFALSEDFSDAETQIIPDHSSMVFIPNLIPDHTYYFKVEAGDDVLNQGQFKVEGPVRMIYAPSINNIRDIGGWTVQDGKKVRYGLIYRGGEANGLHPSVAEDRQTLIDLGVGAEIDLRKDNNYDSGNGQVGKCAFGFPAADYFFKEGGYDCKLEHLTNAQSKARYKQWFPFILNHIREGKAVYYHCVWGADRTGLVSVLLEGLLGFSQEQMNKEYELTSLSFAGLRPKSGYADGDHQKLIEKIKTYEGETLRDKFDTYWTQEVGITKEQIEEFRSIMLVDPIEDTAVREVNAASPSDEAIYDVTGRQVVKPVRGLYVIGGKKVLVK